MTRPVAVLSNAAHAFAQPLARTFAEVGFGLAFYDGAHPNEAQMRAAELNAEYGTQTAAAIGSVQARKANGARLLTEAQAALGGPVQVLVQIAQTFGHDTALNADLDALARHMDTNLYAPLGLAQAFAHALHGPAKGLILHIVDTPLLDIEAEPFSALLSLHTLSTMTRMLAVALAPRVRVNLLGPGPVLPVLRSIHKEETQGDGAQGKEAQALSTQGKLALADAVRYVLSAEAVTGQAFALDLTSSVRPPPDAPSTDKSG